MKRLCCLLLALALLGLCACAQGAAPASSLPAQVQGPGLGRHSLVEEARPLLLQESIPARVQLTPDAHHGQRVETTPALLAGIAEALYYGAQEGQAVVETDDGGVPVPGPSNDPNAPLIVLTMPGEGMEIDLRKGMEGCDVIIVLGQRSVQLAYPAAVYNTVLALAEESLVPDIIVFEGDDVPMATPTGGGEVSITQWMDCAGGLAALYGGEASALEIFSPETGESLYYKDIGGQALRMQAASFAACDMRVVMADGAMWYLNSRNPDVKPYYFYLPTALRSRMLAPVRTDGPTIRGFDGGTGQGALWAVADAEGLFWARRSSTGSVESSVILENLPEEIVPDKDDPFLREFPPQFGDVRLMNGGATLVATVVLPTSQIGNAGIFTYHIASKTMNWYFGMFKPMMADLRFVDDTHLLVAGDEEIWHLNVATGEESTTPAPENISTSLSLDYERYVFTSQTLNPDGTETSGLYTDYEETPFVSATGGSGVLRAAGATQSHVLFVLQQDGGQTWHLAPWP